ncbi:short-chain fatty acyl-CoA regulator family protein [Paucibacter sp. B51]|uniref:short-chain fatty acyl-CoA regulator family protein n=1 Tax=Paucibacter sp. B51 TaxID=2993315 RepID=UPI0022EBEDB8|nr:short-chain fatty acyl-CoA regulator family protein [Paucibacter sp. B51]
MRKTFLGVKLKTLREQRVMTQAALAQALELSPSYLNQLENNQRPLTVPVLLRLQSTLGVDLQFFSEDDDARMTAQLQEIVAETAVPGGVPDAELRTLATQMPALSQLLIRLHQRAQGAEERVMNLAAILGERGGEEFPGVQPHEEVRDFFYAQNNHMAGLDECAEAHYEQLHAKATPNADLPDLLQSYLADRHGVTLQTLGSDQPLLRRYEPGQRRLQVTDSATPGQRGFQLATQLAYLEADDLIGTTADTGNFTSVEAKALARIGLASYFAGALVLPYGRFLAAAQLARYDIDLLAQQFGVSFETVCHRLSTLQRPQARGIPFFFVRVDRAGNISKRQSATDFHFSRSGGTCPLWNVYEAFAQPGKVLTQVASMPDGRNYLWIARSETRQTGGYGSPARSFAIGLGCDIRHASQLVYAKGLDLTTPESATPIGPGCKLCERQGCAQRAFPALGRRLSIDEGERLKEPYAAT